MLVCMKAVNELFLIQLPYRGVMLHKIEKVISFDGLDFRRFDTFQVEQAWRAFIQTVERVAVLDDGLHVRLRPIR